MSPKSTWSDKLKKWRRVHEEQYAKAIMEPPQHTTMLKNIPVPGLVLIMGAKGKGKSALAHAIAQSIHSRRGWEAVLHLPKIPEKLSKEIQKLLPDWMCVVMSTEKWPKKTIVIYDEAAQTAHARRTQSGDAVELDNLMAISRQREQVIIFIAHHSRKLDPNVIRDIDRIVWKSPTFAHWIFERNELTDFVLKAVEFFAKLTPAKSLKTNLVMDFHRFRFEQFSNQLPKHWSEKLSHLFEDVQVVSKAKSAKK